MPSTVTVDNAVDDAGDAGIETVSVQSAPPIVTLDSIMEFLLSLKTEIDGMKADAALVTTPPSNAIPSVTIEIICRPTSAVAVSSPAV